MKTDTFTLRLSSDDRQLITALARRLERSQGDVLRLLAREKARELGVTPTAPKDDRHVAQAT